ncbi:Uncharacterised protein [Bordetella pertussis]|nr:Uncharacterised protein [Bordetella pertussis]CFP60931.1 Uncharacterised protein [Bordetella pertussis]
MVEKRVQPCRSARYSALANCQACIEEAPM